ncbi:SPASM domain-containing protein [Thalassospira xiamenensis]|nr:SPASM domain-containing protein [Thalassospira xiamenensis]
MKEDDFKQSVDFIAGQLLPLYGYGRGNNSHCSVQYIGGEILTVPRMQLHNCVNYARDRLAMVFDTVRDGVQSNLIGSEDRVVGLQTLFGHRIGTSVDTFGDQRKIVGDPEVYRHMLSKSRAVLMRRRKTNPSAVFVLDAQGVKNAAAEADIAQENNYGLGFRPVFRGGRSVNAASIDDLVDTYVDVFDQWVFKKTIIIQPFFQLLASRLATRSGDSAQLFSEGGCPFQSKCGALSLNLEPNGDLYICQDMADSDQFCLGNAVRGEFKEGIWESLCRRSEHLTSECQSCPYRRECEGGCMSEAIHRTGDPYGRTDLCPVWKSLFSRIDEVIDDHGCDKLRGWLYDLDGASRA